MPAAWNFAFFVAITFAVQVTADDGDDFSNNLFSDLAPILALFGERVTMQFMSQSMGWADNIILAMAPLGIVTTIVSAIRVGGPVWLRTIVGRARENLAAAEMELMSSTSNEVCELRNDQAVVRCMGKSPISEFVCLLPDTRQMNDGGRLNEKEVNSWQGFSRLCRRWYHPQQGTTTNLAGSLPREIEVIDFKTAKDKKYLEDIELNVREDFRRWRASKNTAYNVNAEAGQASTDHSPSKVIITRIVRDGAPNISLNSHRSFWRGQLRAAAAFGMILQLAVLVYSGLTVYYPAWGFKKEDLPVSDYAFPCTAAGTLVLVAGILVCSNVVESSTEEKRYQAGEGKRARLVWLQQTKTVSDQEFHSSAIFAEDDREVITISSRAKKDEAAGAEAERHTPIDGDTASNRDHTLIQELKTILGTSVGLCGFVVQFIGLRGMHWSVSVAQLGAVLVMTSLRALVRRGLARPPQSEYLIPGFELEWFAMTLGELDKAPWLHTKTEGKSNESSSHSWKILTGASHETYKMLDPEETDDNPQPTQDDRSMAYKVMMARRDLGELAGWRGPVSTEAICLASAIERVMNVLSESFDADSFTWFLTARHSGSDPQLIKFRLERHDRIWKAFADEIEAALSLWLYSVDKQERQSPQNEDQSGPPRTRPSKNDTWLRASGPSAKQGLRLLGPRTSALLRDLRWWIPSGASGILEVEEVEEEDQEDEEEEYDDEDEYNKKVVLRVENHRVVGCGQQEEVTTGSKGSDYNSTSQQGIRFESQEVNFNPADISASEDAGKMFLATKNEDPLPLLYAQDMFSAFMWAVAKTLKGPIKGGSEMRPDGTSGADAWKAFTLRNDRLSKLAQEVQKSRLGSLDQIYLSIIPPLSMEGKLPEPVEIIELARQHAKRSEELQHWEEAGDAYLWLFRAARTFPKHSGIVTRATAVLLEYLRTITLALRSREEQRYEKEDTEELEKLKPILEEELKTIDQHVLSRLMRLYKDQGRPWKCDIIPETKPAEEDTNYPKTFGLTELHDAAQSGDVWELTCLLVTEGNANPKDVYHWTPLYYGVTNEPTDPVETLLRHGADVNARDLLEWTPLHYACQQGRTSALPHLLREGAELDARGKDGVAPLHCAAMNGHLDIVCSLVEAGATIDVLDASRNTPLLWASFFGYKEIVRYLRDDANKKLRNQNGSTALHLAAIAGIKEEAEVAKGVDEHAVVGLLLKSGADKEARDKKRRTPLHVAASYGQEATAALLLSVGAEVEAKNKIGLTPLHVAAHHGQGPITRLLLGAGADKEAKDSFGQATEGRTPLQLAARYGHETVVAVLLDAGADKEASDKFGRTPLYEAATYGHGAAVALLLNAGADKEATDSFGKTIEGRTPLHRAVRYSHEAAIGLLLNAGADKEAKDSFGRTPLHIAAHYGQEIAAVLLLDAGADKDAEDNKGRKPSHTATHQGHKAVARLILDAGADKAAEDNEGRNPSH